MTVEEMARALADHLTLTRPLVCVDLEATGLWGVGARFLGFRPVTFDPLVIARTGVGA